MTNPLNTSNSLAANFNQVNQLMTDVANDKSVRIIKDDTGTPVVILSKDGLQTTAPGSGIDVTSATDSQYTFNSSRNTFKIVSSGTSTVPAYNLTANQLRADANTIPHGLTYIPILLAYALVDAYIVTANGGTFTTTQSYVSLPYNGQAGIPDSNIAKYFINSYINATNIYFNWVYQTTSGGSGYNFKATSIKYYLLQESAS